MVIIGIFQKKVMIFSELVSDLQSELKKDLAQIRFLLNKNPAMAIPAKISATAVIIFAGRINCSTENNFIYY